MKLWPDKNSLSTYTASLKERWLCTRATPPSSPEPSATPGPAPGPASNPAPPPPLPGLRRAMSLSSFTLMQTLKNSPAALRRRFGRDRTETLSHGDPLFKVHYLGTEKMFSLDRQQAHDAIGRLLEAAAAAGGGGGKKPGKDHALVVRPRYVEVKELSTGRQLAKTYLRDIAYCAADAARPNVFLYICRHRGQTLQCRVFWCSRPERARELTACLAGSFQRALSDWQGEGRPGETRLAATGEPGEEEEEEGRGEEEEEGEEPAPGASAPSVRAKSCTLPATLGKVRWRKRGSVSRSPLRAITRRGSGSETWT